MVRLIFPDSLHALRALPSKQRSRCFLAVFLRACVFAAAMAALPVAPAAAQGFKFSQPDESAQAGRRRGGSAPGDDRRPAVDALPRRTARQEDHGDHRPGPEQRLHRRAAAELRPALPGDQQAAAGARPSDLHARGDPRADQAGGDRRVFQERPRRDALRVAPPRRKLRPARIDHDAGGHESADAGQSGDGEHGVHADHERWARGVGRGREQRIVFGHGRVKHGADARERKGRRGRRAALRRLLSQRGAARRRRGPRRRSNDDAPDGSGQSTGDEDEFSTCMQARAVRRRRRARRDRWRSQPRSRRSATPRRPRARRRRRRPIRGRPGRLSGGHVHEREQEGPGARRDSGRGQEQQCDVPAEVHPEQHRGLRRDRALRGELPGAGALESGRAAQRIHARLQPRRSGGGAQVPAAWASSRRRSTS